MPRSRSSNYLPNGRLTLWAYQERRRALMKRICPLQRCHHCGKKAPSWASLEFDHGEHGRAYVIRKLSRDQRLRMYEREVEAGIFLVGSCAPCNKSAGGSKRYRWQDRRRRERGLPGYSARAFAEAQAAHYAAQLEKQEVIEPA